MNTSKTSISAVNTPSRSTTSRGRKAMRPGLFGPPYGCPGHESVSFNEDVLRAREAAAKGILPVTGEMASPTDPVEANRG